MPGELPLRVRTMTASLGRVLGCGAAFQEMPMTAPYCQEASHLWLSNPEMFDLFTSETLPVNFVCDPFGGENSGGIVRSCFCHFSLVLGGVLKKLLMDGHLKSHREIHQIARTRAGRQLPCVINVPGFSDFQLQSAPIRLAWASLEARW